MLRLPVWRCSPDEAMWTGPLSPSDGRKRNSLIFDGAFQRDICGRKVSGVQSGEQIVIICLSCQPASNLMKFDGKGRFRVEGDWMPAIWKNLKEHCEALWDNSWVSSCQINVLRFKCFSIQVWLDWNQGLGVCQAWTSRCISLTASIDLEKKKKKANKMCNCVK